MAKRKKSSNNEIADILLGDELPPYIRKSLSNLRSALPDVYHRKVQSEIIAASEFIIEVLKLAKERNVQVLAIKVSDINGTSSYLKKKK